MYSDRSNFQLASQLNTPIYCLLLYAIFLCVAILTNSTISESEAADSSERVNIILSNLPSANSKAYADLRKIAGKIDGQTLDMTNSQMWSVENSKVKHLAQVAKRHGVRIKQLPRDWNHIFTEMKTTDAMSPKEKKMMALMMDSKAAMGMQMMAATDPSMMEFALTKGATKMMGRSEAFTPEETELVIPLDHDKKIRVQRTGVELTEEGCIWHGKVAGTEHPVTLMWWKDGRLTGTVYFDDKMYSIKNMGGRLHAIVEMSVDKMPDEHPMMKGAPPTMKPEEDPLVRTGDLSLMRPAARIEKSEPQAERRQVPGEKSENTQTTISLLVAYTSAAAHHYNNIEKDLIALAIEETNQSFRNSKVNNVRVKLAHSYMTTYGEGDKHHFDHVWRFADRGDGYMDEVHKLRNKYKADIALLIVDDPAGCGLATRVGADAEEAFAVVHHECAAMSYSLAHEIGHIIGTRHDRSLDTHERPFPFGHGYVSSSLKWRTMMSYKATCNACPRLPFWSNPDVTIWGESTGGELSNNARVIMEQSARVANFR